MKISKNTIMILVSLGVVGLLLFAYNEGKSFRPYDSFTNGGGGGENPFSSNMNQLTVAASDQQSASAPTDAVTSQPNKLGEVSNSGSLLPKDSNSQWSDLNPTSNTDGIMLPDMLVAGAQYGILGPTMKNANLQIRSDPQIEKNENLSPWGISSYDASNNNPQVAFELGCGQR